MLWLEGLNMFIPYKLTDRGYRFMSKKSRSNTPKKDKKIQVETIGEPEKYIPAPPIWVAISDAQPGLNVMRGIFTNEFSVVRVQKIDRGPDIVVRVFTPDMQQVHSLIAEQASYQKVKE